MKKFVFTLVVLMLMASVANAHSEPDTIGLYGDTETYICDAYIGPGSLTTVYFVVTIDMDTRSAIRAAEFRTENFPQHGALGMVNLIWEGDRVVVEEGSTEVGVSIAFNEPAVGPHVVLGTALIVPFANVWPSNTICRILPHGVSGMLSFVDENYEVVPANRHHLLWNCDEMVFPCSCRCLCMPTQEMSFSSIKALY
ncbi:MAG: hypothetical protein GY835_07035 [bacterium]|nr:hypothetical protein [bacterium]